MGKRTKTIENALIKKFREMPPEQAFMYMCILTVGFAEFAAEAKGKDGPMKSSLYNMTGGGEGKSSNIDLLLAIASPFSPVAAGINIAKTYAETR